MTELRDNTFYASITLRVNGAELEIDSRPSDAIALAVRADAPIFAAEDVIAESAIEFEHEVEDTEEVVDKFKEFLDEVSPEDFAGDLSLAALRPQRQRERSRPISSSKQIPAASAAWGSRLVSVSPGIDVGLEHVQLAAALREHAGRPARSRGSRAARDVDAPAPAARSVGAWPSSAGQTKRVRPIS